GEDTTADTTEDTTADTEADTAPDTEDDTTADGSGTPVDDTTADTENDTAADTAEDTRDETRPRATESGCAAAGTRSNIGSILFVLAGVLLFAVRASRNIRARRAANRRFKATAQPR
ncbi:MAG: hypothetical protein HQ461_14730, partial [Deltaproteobacteria bacterium]|nr:hypothetical protein [Deltaproteobacteria bacterium]